MIADAVVVFAAAKLTAFVLAAAGHAAPPAMVPGVVALTLFFQAVHSLYPACGLTYSVEFRRILRTLGIVVAAVAFALFIDGDASTGDVLAFVTSMLFLGVGLTVVRPVMRRFLKRFDWWAQPVLVIGGDDSGIALSRRLESLRHEGIRCVGVAYDTARQWGDDFTGDARTPPTSRWVVNLTRPEPAPLVCQYDDDSTWHDQPAALQGVNLSLSSATGDQHTSLGSVESLDSILLSSGVCRVAVTDRTDNAPASFGRFHGVPHVILPTDFDNQPCERVRLTENNGRIEIHCRTSLTGPHALFAKRLLDLTLIAVTSPIWVALMVGIALAMVVLDRGPLFYRQQRVGRFRRPFMALKFRSMVVDAEVKLQRYLDDHPEMRAEWLATHKLRQDPRVTRLGRFLRKTSLDELPQIFNVIRGDMALVGPRPIVDHGDYDRKYIQEHPDVFELYMLVRPGITGLWQVSGRNQTAYVQRVYFDRFYLNNWSLTMDVFILWRTVKTALFREGAC